MDVNDSELEGVIRPWKYQYLLKPEPAWRSGGNNRKLGGVMSLPKKRAGLNINASQVTSRRPVCILPVEKLSWEEAWQAVIFRYHRTPFLPPVKATFFHYSWNSEPRVSCRSGAHVTSFVFHRQVARNHTGVQLRSWIFLSHTHSHIHSRTIHSAGKYPPRTLLNSGTPFQVTDSSCRDEYVLEYWISSGTLGIGTSSVDYFHKLNIFIYLCYFPFVTCQMV